jgi:hypothetical protein
MVGYLKQQSNAVGIPLHPYSTAVFLAVQSVMAERILKPEVALLLLSACWSAGAAAASGCHFLCDRKPHYCTACRAGGILQVGYNILT